MTWLRVEMLRTLNMWAGNPPNAGMLALLLFMGALAFVIVLHHAARAVHSPQPGWIRASAVVVFGVLLVAAATAAAGHYLAPHVAHPGLRRLLPIAIPLLGILLLVVPLCALLHRINLVQSLIAVVVGTLTAAVVILLVTAAIGAIRSGESEVRKTRSRSNALREIL